MTTDYLLWPNSNPVPYACVLGNLTGFKDLYRLWAGQSFREKFPPDAEFSMSPDFPDNTILTDSLMNRYHLVVGSEKLKNFFEEKPVPLVECLPVAIRDHKGKIAAHYFVVNPLNAVDCLDYTASGALVSNVINTQVISTQRLVLREDAVDSERPFFRIAGYPQMRLIQRNLAEEIQKAGFSGIKFRELDQTGK